jgi:hypothetical protein
MFPEISDEVLRFLLFVFLSIRIFYDFFYKIIRFIIGGGSK